MSNVLVIHPDDRSTDFLKLIYQDKDYDVITDCFLSEVELKREIMKHDKIIMMGHGTQFGLINPQNHHKLYLIDSSFVPLLKIKDTISIWCNSDEFFIKNNIHDGNLHTGMIISETNEEYYIFRSVTLSEEEMLDNMMLFGHVIGECIDKSPDEMLEYIHNNYNRKDRVSEFNRNNIIFI